jgi:hypothetical protein
MDMKKILRAVDGANTKAEVNSSDIKKFLTIVEGKGPLNRPTAAESIAMQHYTEPARKTITAPVLNVAEDATPSMIGKYFKAVEQELVEAADRSKDRARQLAGRVTDKVSKQGVAEGSEDLASLRAKANEISNRIDAIVKDGGRVGFNDPLSRQLKAIRSKIQQAKKKGVAECLEQYRYTDILEMARQGLSDEEIAEQLGFDLNEGLKDPKDNPCWKGYKPVGTKKKGGKTVPNCVPKE